MRTIRFSATLTSWFVPFWKLRKQCLLPAVLLATICLCWRVYLKDISYRLPCFALFSTILWSEVDLNCVNWYRTVLYDCNTFFLLFCFIIMLSNQWHRKHTGLKIFFVTVERNVHSWNLFRTKTIKHDTWKCLHFLATVFNVYWPITWESIWWWEVTAITKCTFLHKLGQMIAHRNSVGSLL